MKSKRIVKASAAEIHQKRKEILDFAHQNHMVLHPAGWDDYINNYFEFKCCVCDKTRLSCPCKESIEEVKSIGHCKCRMFWKDYQAFKEDRYIPEGTNGGK